MPQKPSQPTLKKTIPFQIFAETSAKTIDIEIMKHQNNEIDRVPPPDKE